VRPDLPRADVLRLAVRAYRVMAYVTGVMLIILCFICMPLRYFAHIPAPAQVVGACHGVLYMIYIVVAFAMTRLVRMKVASFGTIIVLLAGTIPVLTFVVERWVSRAYIAPALASGVGDNGASDSGVSGSEQPVLR
jgi:integral membrane protein